MWAIYKKEMLSYYTCPMGYVFSVVLFILSGLLFAISTFMVDSTSMDSYFLVMTFSLVILVPLLTMKLLSEERNTRTEQILLTAPISLTGMVLAKFFAAFTVFCGNFILSVWLNVSLLNGFAVEKNSDDVIDKVKNLSSKIDFIKLNGCIVGILLLSAVLIALGLLVSALTKTQMIAAVTSMGIILILAILFIFKQMTDNELVHKFVDWLSVFSRYDDFLLGLFDFTHIAYYISLTVIFLFITVRIYEKRRWS